MDAEDSDKWRGVATGRGGFHWANRTSRSRPHFSRDPCDGTSRFAGEKHDAYPKARRSLVTERDAEVLLAESQAAGRDGEHAHPVGRARPATDAQEGSISPWSLLVRKNENSMSLSRTEDAGEAITSAIPEAWIP